MANYSTIKVNINSEDLDIAIEKAKQLNGLLEQAQSKIDSLSDFSIKLEGKKLSQLVKQATHDIALGG